MPDTNTGKENEAPSEYPEYEKTDDYISMSISAAKERQEMRHTPEEFKRRAAVLGALEKTSGELVIETDVNSILKRIAEILGTSLKARYVSFWGYVPDKKGVSILAAYGMKDEYIDYSRGNPVPIDAAWSGVGRAIKTGQAWSSSDIRKDPHLPKDWLPAITEQDYHGLLCAPLVQGKNAVGGLCIYYEDVHEFDYFEMSIATIAANQAATAMENARMFGNLVTEKNKTASIIHSLNDGLIMYDTDGRIIFFNPKAQEFLLVELKDALGKKLEEIPPRGTIYLENLSRINKLLSNDYETKEYATKGPQRLILKVTQVPVRDSNNKRIGTMHILQNITREKEIEQLKSQFVTVASHQLRTPLASLKWSLDALRKGEYGVLDQKQLEMVQKLFATNEHLITLINDLLDVSRIEEGKFDYAFASGDIVPVIENVLEELRETARERDVALIFEKPAEPLPQPRIDANKIELAIQNIIENGVRYTNAGGRVTVRLEVKDGAFLIVVRDTGVGIPKKDRRFIFNKFFRASSAIRHQTEGSGLGLFIAKNIVEKHNGTLTFTSNIGKGTTFVITLPLDSGKIPRREAM